MLKTKYVFVMKRKVSIFAASSAKTMIALLGAGFFFSACTGRYNNGLPVPNGFCTVRSEIVFAEMGNSAALFLHTYFCFSFMAKTMKNASDTQGVFTSAPIGATSVSLEAFNIERDAKNHCYYFILSHGLLTQFADYCCNVQANDPHTACISILSTQITES